jgi:purine nucleoside phosphorylase
MGADLVGHWGVAEVIVARHMGMRVLCLLTVAEREGAAVAPEASAAGRTGVAAILARVASGAE